MNNPAPSAPPLDDDPYYVPNKSYQANDPIPVVSAIPVSAIPVSAIPVTATPVTATTVEGYNGYEPPPQSTGPKPVTGVLPTAGTTTTTTTTSNVINIEDLGRIPLEYTCPFCSHTGRTKVTHEFSTGSLIYIVAACFLFWPAVFCVCCCKELQDSTHRCKNCGRVVGRTPSYAECC